MAVPAAAITLPGNEHGLGGTHLHQPPSRNLRSHAALRPPLKRRSPLAAGTVTRSQQAAYMTRAARTESLADSSDDDGPAPALSAAAEELLRTEDRVEKIGIKSVAAGAAAIHSGSPVSRIRQVPPPSALASPSPRVVKVSRTSPAASLRRTNSTSSIANGSPRPVERDLKTPAARPRSALATSESKLPSAASVAATSIGPRSGSRIESAEKKSEGPSESVLPARPGLNRSQFDDREPHSIRIKRTGRVGGLSGNFLKGPARRGVIRRQSDEEHSAVSPGKLNPLGEAGRANESVSALSPNKESPRSALNHVRFANGADMVSIPKVLQLPSADSNPPSQRKASPIHVLASEDAKSSENANKENEVPPKPRAAVYKAPPHLPSHFDQENEPPPTFKRNKPGLDVLGAEKMRLQSAEKPRAQGSPRKALAPRNHNTPLRPAPPPPKMSVLETATANAGAASVTQNKKKKNYISVNGKLFSRMECIGRGGSGRVYRVMAENFKLFALKRVSLEDVDEMAIRGFKGEIDLLRKLEKVERVVRLYDYEINDEKKTLSVLMDIGELDLKKILDPRLDEETGRLDLTFTRNMWKEMLECVQAVHEYDVVHSDLKPANFVMMQGRLKLIDFGIANAIQDDTVNVHREHQIGTPNYMAPEALLDTNAMAGKTSNLGKLMKLGKPSDVWSLGCILYQIVYGKPPFGHIPNSMSKVMAITDRNHAINFPEAGIGGVPVPTGLIRTMKRTLNRDPALRPTIPQLLDPRDPFLYPDAPGTIPVTQEIVRKLQENVLKIIEAKGMPGAQGAKPKEEAVKEWLDQWSPQLFASIKASLEKGAA